MQVLQGSLVALVTPFLKNGDVDYDSLSSLLDWHIANETDGIVSVGTTGESATLNVKEHIEVIDYSVKYVQNRIPVIAGTGANSTDEAIELSLEAKLNFIAPKGNEEQGAVQFIIEADLFLNDSIFIRAGYSANASLVLEKKDNVMAISESLLQFDRDTEEPYVEIVIGEQKFERRDVEIGLSDGVNVELISGISMEDKIKVWNKTEPIKKGDEDSERGGQKN